MNTYEDVKKRLQTSMSRVLSTPIPRPGMFIKHT